MRIRLVLALIASSFAATIRAQPSSSSAADIANHAVAFIEKCEGGTLTKLTAQYLGLPGFTPTAEGETFARRMHIPAGSALLVYSRAPVGGTATPDRLYLVVANGRKWTVANGRKSTDEETYFLATLAGRLERAVTIRGNRNKYGLPNAVTLSRNEEDVSSLEIQSRFENGMKALEITIVEYEKKEAQRRAARAGK